MISKIWKQNNFLSYLLLPLSLIYFLSYQIYIFFRQEKKIDIPVICVGNVTLGGAGKTPTVIKIRKLLNDKFENIFVLTRGYKGKKSGPIIVNKKSSFLDVGDESLLHFKYGTTCVAKNKLLGAKFSEEMGCDLLIMDDGLQSINIKKNLKILVIDGEFAFGNEKLFPSGPLREPITNCIDKCDIIVIIGNRKFLMKSQIFSHKKVFFASKQISIHKVKNKNLFVFSALGNNKNFHNSLLEKGLKIKRYKEFPDHHIFKKSEIVKILSEAKDYNLTTVCTEKDYLKVPLKFQKKIIPIPMFLCIQRTKIFKQEILKKLRN